MKKASRLHNALKSWMGQDAHWGHLSHLTTGILLVVALIQTGSVSLTKWTVYLPNRGTKQRAQKNKGFNRNQIIG